jgi:ribosomal protein L11 methyltransferase
LISGFALFPYPKMIQIKVSIDVDLASELEALGSARDITPWMIIQDYTEGTYLLSGYFENPEEGENSYAQLRGLFSTLPESAVSEPVEDRDWKEAYKDHFKPWKADNLHWVPVWERESYVVPSDEKAVYLDPGMAFGTGNHESTRLCALRLIEICAKWNKTLAQKSVIDAGCGSGILAISAAIMGFGQIKGFDIDPDTIEIACENARINQVDATIHFSQADLNEGLGNVKADFVMANILANVLCAHAEVLLKSVNSGGYLSLSGILAHEVAGVSECFHLAAARLWGTATLQSRIDGEWGDVLIHHPSSEELAE